MTPDPSRIENMKQNAAVLTAMLDHRNLKYTVQEQTDARTHIRIRFSGADLPMTLHIILRADKQIASVFSVMPFAVAEERRKDAAVAVAAANHGLIDGSFDLNLSSGEIRFRLTSCFIDSVLSESLFSYLMFVSAETVDRYNDRFLALNSGDMTLEQFLAADAADGAAP
ncbi:MAG: YbjN domain-containing protein [Oscillospiraceae bacterium]|nr:YbjN domain-containing protein [Oscillospiraceae bacterium]MBR5722547.1 YbjN domain-containing protein [Oscillospiraceae bacterium]